MWQTRRGLAICPLDSPLCSFISRWPRRSSKNLFTTIYSFSSTCGLPSFPLKSKLLLPVLHSSWWHRGFNWQMCPRIPYYYGAFICTYLINLVILVSQEEKMFNAWVTKLGEFGQRAQCCPTELEEAAFYQKKELLKGGEGLWAIRRVIEDSWAKM